VKVWDRTDYVEHNGLNYIFPIGAMAPQQTANDGPDFRKEALDGFHGLLPYQYEKHRYATN